jgi:hypothetical protein
LDLNVISNTSNYTVSLDTIFANGSGVVYANTDTIADDSALLFNKASGAAGPFQAVVLGTTAEVARSTTAKTAVQAVSFTVTDDE